MFALRQNDYKEYNTVKNAHGVGEPTKLVPKFPNDGVPIKSAISRTNDEGAPVSARQEVIAQI